jgi:hypothetical protein
VQAVPEGPWPEGVRSGTDWLEGTGHPQGAKRPEW